MSLFKEYETEYERNADILTRRCDLALSTANSTFMYESAILTSMIDNPLMEAASETDDSDKSVGEKAKKIFTDFVTSIVTAVKNFFSGIVESITELFSKQEEINLQNYLSSQTGTIEVNSDIMKIKREVEAERAKGRKLIDKICSATGADPVEVSKFVDAPANFIDKHHRTILKAVVAAGAFAVVKKSMSDGNESLRDVSNKVLNDPNMDSEKQRHARAVLSKLGQLEKGYGNIIMDFFNGLSKDARKAAKKATK